MEQGNKEGRYLIALDHGGTMGSGSLSLIGSSRASADGFRRSLSEGRAMEQGGAISDRPGPWGDNGKWFPFTHWLTMGIGGRIPPLLE